MNTTLHTTAAKPRRAIEFDGNEAYYSNQDFPRRGILPESFQAFGPGVEHEVIDTTKTKLYQTFAILSLAAVVCFTLFLLIE